MQIVTSDKIPATDARRPRENWNAKFFHGRPACTACQNSHGDGLECAFDIALDVRDRAHLRCFPPVVQRPLSAAKQKDVIVTLQESEEALEE